MVPERGNNARRLSDALPSPLPAALVFLFWDPTTVYIYQTPLAVFPFGLKARLLQLGAVF
jgi:hypothetical protein